MRHATLMCVFLLLMHSTVTLSKAGPLQSLLEERTFLQDWSCVNAPQRCAVLFHVFAKNGTGAPSPSYLQMGLDFWQGFIAAASMRSRGLSPDSPIILATNYPYELLRRAERDWPSLIVNRTLNQEAWRRSSLRSNPASCRGTAAETTQCQERLRLLQNVLTPETLRRVGWPFDAYRLYEETNTVYSMKAIALNATLLGDIVPTATTRCRSVTWNQPFARTLFVDSDTVTLRDVTPALDVLAAADLGLVGEYRGFGSFAQYLYGDLLQAPEKFSVYAYPNKKSKKYYDYETATVYEEQFNTGLIAFRGTNAIRRFFLQWERYHRSSKRCSRDSVAWDQCSLPHVLRRSSLRLVTLPAEFNFRTALGNGCEGPMYESVTTMQQIKQPGNMSAATVVHDFVKPAMNAFLSINVFGVTEW